MAREKVNGLANKKMLEGGDSSGLNNGMEESKKHLSRQEREILVANDALGRAARQGAETEDLAISTKVNLQGQTDQTFRIEKNVTDLRNRDVRHGDKILTDIENVRRKNLCILFSIFTMLFLALFYIIWSNYNKHFGKT